MSDMPVSSSQPRISRTPCFSGMPASFTARIAYSAHSAGPLSSVVPRPYIRPFSISPASGSCFQPSPMGTTSRWASMPMV